MIHTQVKDGLKPASFGQAPHHEGAGGFFWLSAFWFIYCARPEDYIPLVGYIPLAKITALFAFMALLMSAGTAKRKLPREGWYLIALILYMMVTSILSPVWKSGALNHTIDFAKGGVAWVLTYLLVTNFVRLRRIIFIQAASVAMVAAVSVVKGRNTPRLEGVLNGMYDNANDLAFALALSLPFCLAFLLQARSTIRKIFWLGCMLIMVAALFLTASRSGFIVLVISGVVLLWHFGVKGKRPMLIVSSLLFVAIVTAAAGGHLTKRFEAIGGNYDSEDQSAYGSFEDRKALMIHAAEAMLHYPLWGVGCKNFVTYSGEWREVHNAYLQIGAEGGIPAFILYILFFRAGFKNLAKLRKREDLPPNIVYFVWALHSSLIAFVVGAFFGPEAYQLFSFIAVAQTSVLLAIIEENATAEASPVPRKSNFAWYDRYRSPAGALSNPRPAPR